jgi:uncharacterized protein (UPF0179 family)
VLNLKVSYLTGEKTAKRGKPFVDGEFVKECLQCAVDIVCPAEKQADIIIIIIIYSP